MNNNDRFVVRVYGIAIRNRHILLCDEYWFGTEMTKFPGGGLEFGEGTIDCLRRECMEEFGQEVEVGAHLYTTDFYQPTRFLKDKQLISIYYRIILPNPDVIPVSDQRQPFPDWKEGSMAFRWCPLDRLDEGGLIFPIDRHVLSMLRNGVDAF